MIEVTANLWDFHAKGHHVVVTTNIGWAPGNPWNNMGAGMALQAAYRYPELPGWYGRRCREYGAGTPVLKRDDLGLVFLPVKPLLEENPGASWNQTASLELIARGLDQLLAWVTTRKAKVAMGLPGAGNGRLDPVEVLGLVRDKLGFRRGIVLADWRLGRLVGGSTRR